MATARLRVQNFFSRSIYVICARIKKTVNIKQIKQDRISGIMWEIRDVSLCVLENAVNIVIY